MTELMRSINTSLTNLAPVFMCDLARVRKDLLKGH